MKHWRDFRGTTGRRNFWLFVLFLLLISLAIDLAEAFYSATEDSFRLRFGLYLRLGTDESWQDNIFTALFAVPFMSAFTRRCHDAGYRASNFLVFFFAAFVLNVFIGKAYGFVPVPTGVAFFAIFALFAWIIFVLTRPSTETRKEKGWNPPEVLK